MYPFAVVDLSNVVTMAQADIRLIIRDAPSNALFFVKNSAHVSFSFFPSYDSLASHGAMRIFGFSRMRIGVGFHTIFKRLLRFHSTIFTGI